jgi:hypothetical protein
VNVTVTGPTAAGNLRLYPAGGSVPKVSAINFGPGQTRANNAILKLADGGGLAVFAALSTGSVHLVLDVNGWFD